MNGLGVGFSQVFDKVSCVTCEARCKCCGSASMGRGRGVT